MSDFDAIIVGAGAGGGVAAAVLAEAGLKILVLERGKALSFADEARDPLRTHRNSLYGHNTGPALEGNPRVLVEADGEEKILKPHQGGYQNNASAVGGGTFVYGGHAWRFHPDDFRMASRYGIPKDSSLADWPIRYADLEAGYERAEWEIGVAGDAQTHKFMPRRAKALPMPALPDNPQRQSLSKGAAALGWDWGPVPMLINTKEYLGRPVCEQCGYCVGFACPNGSRAGTHNTVIPRAMATGRCTLLTQVTVSKVLLEAGKAVGVEFFDENGSLQTARARQILLCAGAIETARLLLLSAWDKEPKGIGNNSDHVGRHLQGHYYAGAFGLTESNQFDGKGPGISIATTQFNHGNPGIVGGGMLANEFCGPALLHRAATWPPDLKRWGLDAKRYMREGRKRALHVHGPVQEIPSPDCRVALDHKVKDRFGLPVARLSGSLHPETLRVAAFMQDRAEEWLRASGAKQTWQRQIWTGLSAGQHQAGTCRMGNDPEASVCDAWGRVHGHENLHIADASLHVTNGGFNPVLTIMAMAFRIAGHLAKN
jgi:choline dehydrogenase-like flavoprotein